MHRLSIFALLLIGISGFSPAAAIAATEENFFFDVFRRDSNIGHHNVAVKHDDNGKTVVNVDIHLRVGVGPIALFRYTHQSEEVWQGNTLVSFSSQTNDDGERHQVSGKQSADGENFIIEGTGGNFTVAYPVIPTSYWHPDLIEQSQLFDTQRGIMMPVTIEKGTAEAVPLGQKTISATPYTIQEVDGTVNLTVWRDAENRWVRLVFRSDGSDIIYKPAATHFLRQ